MTFFDTVCLHIYLCRNSMPIYNGRYCHVFAHMWCDTCHMTYTHFYPPQYHSSYIPHNLYIVCFVYASHAIYAMIWKQKDTHRYLLKCPILRLRHLWFPCCNASDTSFILNLTPKPYFWSCTHPACMRIADTIGRRKDRVPLRCRSMRFTDWLYAVNMDLLTLTLHTST